MQDVPPLRGGGLPPSLRFRTAGPVGEGHVYIVRKADSQLFDLLATGEYAYVVGPTQLGKTSLAMRTRDRLVREGHPDAPKGFRCAYLDFHSVGRSADARAWLLTIERRLRKELRMPPPEENDPFAETPAERWRRFLEVDVPASCPERVVIFLDEIGNLLGVDAAVRGDLLGVIRAVQATRKARSPVFCFLGIVDPDDLLTDAHDAPFNVATPVLLDDLTHEGAEKTFLSALAGVPGAAEAFQRAYEWTSGHPYMMQAICDAFARESASGPSSKGPAEAVDSIVKGQFLERRSVLPVLGLIEKNIRKLDDAVRLRALLLYRDLLGGKTCEPRADRPEQIALRLAGIVGIDVDEDDIAGRARLRVRNKVFATVFDAGWAAERIQEIERPYRDELARWRKRGKKREDTLTAEQLAEAEIAFKDLPRTAEENELLAASAARAAADARNARNRFVQGLLTLSAIVVLALGMAVSWYGRAKVADDKARIAREKEELARRVVDLEASRRAEQQEAMQKALDEFQDARRALESLISELEQANKINPSTASDVRGKLRTMESAIVTAGKKVTDLQHKLDEERARAELDHGAPDPDPRDCDARIAEANRVKDAYWRLQMAKARTEQEAARSAAVTDAAAAESKKCEDRLQQAASESKQACHQRVCAAQQIWDSKSPRVVEKCP
jgi:hypothetical protein